MVLASRWVVGWVGEWWTKEFDDAALSRWTASLATRPDGDSGEIKIISGEYLLTVVASTDNRQST